MWSKLPSVSLCSLKSGVDLRVPQKTLADFGSSGNSVTFISLMVSSAFFGGATCKLLTLCVPLFSKVRKLRSFFSITWLGFGFGGLSKRGECTGIGSSILEDRVGNNTSFSFLSGLRGAEVIWTFFSGLLKYSTSCTTLGSLLLCEWQTVAVLQLFLLAYLAL